MEKFQDFVHQIQSFKPKKFDLKGYLKLNIETSTRRTPQTSVTSKIKHSVLPSKLQISQGF